MPPLPDGVAPYRKTPVFTETTIPAGLLRSHSTAAGVWGLIHVLEGRLRYRVIASGNERILEPGTPPGVVEPTVLHEVAPLGPVRFYVEFHRQAGSGAASPPAAPDAPVRAGEAPGRQASGC